MPGNAGGILRDKRVQIGVAAAAGLGLVMLLRSRGAGDVVSSGSGTTPQTMGNGTMDSTGTDVYNAIQSLGQGWENDLREYTSGLDSLTTQVRDNTTGLASLNTAVGKLGTTKPVTTTSTVGFTKLTLDRTGVLGIGKQYGLRTNYIMALPQNVGLRGLTPAQAVGKSIYIPAGFRAKYAQRR